VGCGRGAALLRLAERVGPTGGRLGVAGAPAGAYGLHRLRPTRPADAGEAL